MMGVLECPRSQELFLPLVGTVLYEFLVCGSSGAPITKTGAGNVSFRAAFSATSVFFILILLDSLAVIEFIIP